VEIVLALISAVMFALGSVLQQKAGAAAPTAGASGPLLFRMAQRPVWLVGIVADGLGIGRLDVVQPLLVTSVVFALPLGAWLGDARFGRREAAAAVVVVAGLGVFVALANPAGGRSGAPLGDWLICIAACAALCVPLVLLAPRRPGARRAALLGVAAGILFALSAALTKAVVDHLSDGLTLLTHWQLYALVVVGYVSMTVNQMSLDAGSLSATMATSTSFDPIASVVLGLTLFEETIDTGPLQGVAILLALAVALGAMIVLARDQQQTQTGVDHVG
jgi:drug/metabolite transporter (DMT)-like permease